MPDFSLEPYINCQNVAELEHTIELHAEELHEWSTLEYELLISYKTSIRQFCSVKGSMLSELDFTKPLNRAFIVQLHDACCTIFLVSPATLFYNIISEKELVLGSRLEAAMMVLRSYESNDEFAEAFLPICEKLNTAIKTEEDYEWPSISVFIRYYAKIVRDLPAEYATYIRNQVNQSLGHFSFLQSTPVRNALSTNTTDPERAYASIIAILSSPIESHNHEQRVTPIRSTDSRHEYESRLASCGKHFSEIRSLAYNLVEESIEDSDAVFNTLGRGVRVLTTEDQLLVYMRAYGQMHEAKLKAAFDNFPFDEIGGDIYVVDWGCGQAVATMVLMEYLLAKHPNIHVKRVLLIEPSSVALTRAKLHVCHFDSQVRILSINQGFDSISISDIDLPTDLPVVHLFSNILDYEGFDLANLENIVENKFTGRNYFICSSPQINETKTARLYSFEQYFSHKSRYAHFFDVENSAGTWQNNWTRVLRVFAYGENSTPANRQNNVSQQDGSYDVFISYSVKDYKDSDNRIIPNNVITQIKNALSANGITYWIDNEGLTGGDAFPQRIAAQIHNAKVLLFVSSRNSNQSQWIMNEIATASAYHKPIIPFRLDMTEYAQSIMFYLASLQYICYEGNANALQELVGALNNAM